jgi:hypothetical protein
MQDPEPHKMPKRFSSARKWIKRIAVSLLTFWILLMLLIQIPAVQRYFLHFATDFIEEKSGRKVEVKGFRLKLFDQLTLEEVFIEGYEQDTLLSSGSLAINFKNPIYTYIASGGFTIEGITLDKARLNLKMDSNEGLTNIQRFVNSFNSSVTDKPNNERSASQNLKLDLKELRAYQSSFTRLDSIAGTYQNFQVKELVIHPHTLDLSQSEFIIEDAVLQGLSISIDNFKAIDAPAQKDSSITATSSNPILVQIRNLELSEGEFELDNYARSPFRTKRKDVIDWDHFAVRQIAIRADDFTLYNWNFDGCLNHLSGQTDSGFKLSELKSSYVHVDTHWVHVEGGKIETPYSLWYGDVQFHYDQFPSFRDFTNRVALDVVSQSGSIAIRDIIDFAPKLYEVDFFRENQSRTIELEGWIHGKINELKGDQIYLNVGGTSIIQGTFSSQDLAGTAPAKMNINVDFSETNMNALKSLIPNFSPPKNFYNLGTLNFEGQFNGYFKDFVASGKLVSDIGIANMDMSMDLTQGVEEAEYAGTLNLKDFDLGQWTQDNTFGLVTFDAVVPQGKGLRLKDLDTDLLAEVDQFNYKGYKYTNFRMEGRVIQSTFNGDFSISDENIELGFLGIVDLSEKLPIINVEADIQKIDLLATNLSERDLILSGKGFINIQNYQLEELEAQLNVQNFQLIENDTTIYQLDSLNAIANATDLSNKLISFKSDIGQAEMRGNFNITELWPKLKNEIIDYYPSFSDKLGWSRSLDILEHQNFQASVRILESKNWASFFDPKLDTLSSTELEIYWDDLQDSFYMDFYSPYIRYGTNKIVDPFVYLYTKNGISNAVLGSKEITLSDRITLQSTTIFSDIVKDTLFWTVNSANYEGEVDRFNFHGKMFVRDNYITFNILNDELNLFTDIWTISPYNLIQVGKKFINIQDFNLRNQDREITIKSIDQKGVAAILNEIELNILNDIMVYDKLQFEGILSAAVNYEQIFTEPTLYGNVKVDSLHVNGDDFGVLDIRANAPGNRKVIRLEGGISHPERNLRLGGYLFPTQTREDEEYFDATISMRNYPFKILEYFLNGNIEDTEGTLTGDFVLSGPLRKPVLTGSAMVEEAAVTIPFLGIRLFIDEQEVRSEENRIDATGAVIKDIYGNTATITGGLTHNYFLDLGLDLTIESDEFLLLNTTDDNESIYYGHCVAAAQVAMFGLMATPDIIVKAADTKDTRFFLRTDIESEEVNAGFFRYKEFDDSTSITETNNSEVETIKGVNFSLDLEANESAVVEIIIDKKAGDIIKGRGEGDIRFNLQRSGEITMFGDYVISDGEYLFTSQDIINKTFQVASGSSIRWTGDPFGALLNIRAEYEVYTAPYLFVQELVTDPALEDELRANTQVVLTVLLTGLLYAPDLSFDFRFPQLTGQAKSTVDNKLSILESDPNGLYAQAGALIVLNTFAPSATANGQALGFAAGVNTLSEFVSNQFSNLLSGLLKSAVKDIDFINDIDLQLNYNLNTNELLNGGQATTLENGELRINTTTRLFDRLELDLGGNYGTNNTNSIVGNQGTYFNGNIALQYRLTEDNELVMRIYSLTDQVLEGRRVRSGVGLRYQKEFDTFEEFFNGLQSTIDKGRSGPERPIQSGN